jgi:hypothetical protein
MQQNFLKKDSELTFPSSPKIRVKDGSIAADGAYYRTFEEYESHLMSVTGATDPDIARSIINALARSQGVISEKNEASINNAIGLLVEFHPRNVQEAILASHIIVLHSQAHRLFFMANEMSFNPDVQIEYLKMALQISNSVSTLMEKLQKLRRNRSYQLEFEFMEDYSSSCISVKIVKRERLKAASKTPQVEQEENKRAAIKLKDVPIPVQIPLFK